jgi:hypothetical protein
MEKSLSGHSSYEFAVDSHMRADPGKAQWSTNLNPTDCPLSFHQASIDRISCSGSTNEYIGRRRSKNTMNIHSQQQKISRQQTPYLLSTNTAKKAGLEQRPVGEQLKQQQPEISTAPQTKSQQQQRQALQKLSRAVSNEMEDPSRPVDLEQLVLRILAGTKDIEEGEDEQSGDAQGSSSKRMQADRSNKVFLTKSEAIKATQMISKLIKQSPGSAYSQPRKSSQGSSTNIKVCHICGYAVARACDLKKHMKRHEKPYGCTYPKCHKRFGAKSDWKRHENSQHFQLEAYRCDQPSTLGKICGEHFLRVDHFKNHLEAQHKISDEQQQSDEAKRRKIGKNCQQQFWCGFHGDIIQLKERRNAAWDERFDHIAWHFEKGKKSIEEWVCAEENKTKKELLQEMDRYVFDDEDERGVEGGGNTGPPPSVPIEVPLPPPPPPVNQTPPANVFEQGKGGKRSASADLAESQPQKKHRAKTIVTNSYCVSATTVKFPMTTNLTFLVQLS